ncbi:MAG: undecaprenyl/decaprenyl-phosphate alpha-N-acetylglucosaminyl 1-phosphate transferase [bacterium]|nr:undecaprenyl/decaprenyl-phosphate alpha-N-acetylglucosaminyl 1-phosphate transferase [bacterium]
MNWFFIYGIVFITAFLLSVTFTPLVRRLAFKLDIVDYPDTERKIHTEVKPYLGGVAIFLAFNLVIGIGLIIALTPSTQSLHFLTQDVTQYLSNIKSVLHKLFGIFLGSLVIFILGLIDDMKRLSAMQKLIGQIIAGLIVVLFGVRIELFIPNVYFAGILTILWLTGITNAFNLLDNMDGLSAGVAAISAFIFALFSIQFDHYFIAVILLTLCGAIAGFLPYNFYPSKIFMGDAGSMFIGFALATLTVLSSYYSSEAQTILPVIMPLLVLSVPIFDTISVVIIRLKRHLPIYQADKNHFSHRLVALGMTQWQAVLTIYLVTICIGFSAMLLRRLNWFESLLILIQAIAIFIIIVFLETAGRKNNPKT